MVLDTETTGLPRRVVSGDQNNYDSCRMVQLAWAIYRDDGQRVSERSFIVKPDGFEIPDSATRIHGISTERALSEGTPIRDVLQHLFDEIALQHVDTIVAHNMSFDHSVISSEIYRYALTGGGTGGTGGGTGGRDVGLVDPRCIERWSKIPRKCTMLMGQLPGQRWPKLIDLYRRLYGKEPDETLHRADADVNVCADVYFRLIGVY